MSDTERTIQQDHARFFSILGEAVSTWAYVEGQLYEIVKDRLGAPEAQASVVFGRTPQMGAHVALAGELLQATLPQRHGAIRTWRKLEDRFAKLLPIRNMMVHQPVHYGGAITITVAPDEAGIPTVEVVQETPSDYAFGLSAVAQTRKKPKLPKTLTFADIKSHLDLTRELLADLGAYRRDLPPL